jgi:hypothetical protein
MSRSLDQSRPFRAGRHRAEAAPIITTPLTPTSSDAKAPNPGPAPTEPASPALRRRRDRRPAFEVPPAPESAPAGKAAPPATEEIQAVAAARTSGPESAATAATRRARARREAADEPAEPAPAAAPSSGPATALTPQVATAFNSDAQAVLRRAASVRVMGQRMAVVAGALGVLLAVGAAGQASELPFFGKESTAQDAPGATDATRATLGTQPTDINGRAIPRPSASTPPGAPGAAPAQAAPGIDGLPAVADLPMPVDAPTLAGILAASPAAIPPSPAPTVVLQPPVMSSATPAPTTTAAAAPVPAPAPAPTTTTAPATASPAPSPTPAATSPAEEDGATEEAVDTRSYASSRLASYGWGAEQMNALDALWDTSAKWRPSQVERGLAYIKQRHGSPAQALEFRAANNWY